MALKRSTPLTSTGSRFTLQAPISFTALTLFVYQRNGIVRMICASEASVSRVTQQEARCRLPIFQVL